MRILPILLSLLVLLIGALVGAVLGFFLIIGIGLATGTSTREGGLAMGAAMGGAPLGAVAGAVLALIAVIRWHRMPPDQPFLSNKAMAIVIGLPVIVTLGIGLRIWSITIPEFSSPRPDLLVEIRVAKGAIDNSKTTYKPLWPQYHRAGTYVTPYNLVSEEVTDTHDSAVVRFVMIYKTEPRELALEVERDLFAVFPLEIGRIPEPNERFTDWRAPAFARFEEWGKEPDIRPAPERDIAIRYKVRWEGRE